VVKFYQITWNHNPEDSDLNILFVVYLRMLSADETIKGGMIQTFEGDGSSDG
jgi:hypothetical protein